MTDDLSRRDLLAASALAASAAVDMSGLDIRRVLGSMTGLQPEAREGRLGAPVGAVESWDGEAGLDVADGYGDASVEQGVALKDLIHLGLPNGDFAASDDDDDTSDFWTLTNGSVTWAVVVDSSAPGGYVLRYVATTSAGATPAKIQSARVPVADIFKVAAGFYYNCDDATAAKIDVTLKTLWYGEDGTLLATVTGSTFNPANGDKQRYVGYSQMSNSSATNAAEVALLVEITHIAAGAQSTLDIRTLTLRHVYPPSLVLDRSEALMLSGSTASLSVNGGTTALSGPLYHVADQWIESSFIDAAPASNQNNWNPASSLGSAVVVRVNGTASIDATGLAAGENGKVVWLFNISSTYTITLKHESASSTAANRFLCPGSADYVLGTRRGLALWYDSTSSRWRLLVS